MKFIIHSNTKNHRYQYIFKETNDIYNEDSDNTGTSEQYDFEEPSTFSQNEIQEETSGIPPYKKDIKDFALSIIREPDYFEQMEQIARLQKALEEYKDSLEKEYEGTDLNAQERVESITKSLEPYGFCFNFDEKGNITSIEIPEKQQNLSDIFGKAKNMLLITDISGSMTDGEIQGIQKAVKNVIESQKENSEEEEKTQFAWSSFGHDQESLFWNQKESLYKDIQFSENREENNKKVLQRLREPEIQKAGKGGKNMEFQLDNTYKALSAAYYNQNIPEGEKIHATIITDRDAGMQNINANLLDKIYNFSKHIDISIVYTTKENKAILITWDDFYQKAYDHLHKGNKETTNEEKDGLAKEIPGINNQKELDDIHEEYKKRKESFSELERFSNSQPTNLKEVEKKHNLGDFAPIEERIAKKIPNLSEDKIEALINKIIKLKEENNELDLFFENVKKTFDTLKIPKKDAEKLLTLLEEEYKKSNILSTIGEWLENDTPVYEISEDFYFKHLKPFLETPLLDEHIRRFFKNESNNYMSQNPQIFSEYFNKYCKNNKKPYTIKHTGSKYIMTNTRHNEKIYDMSKDECITIISEVTEEIQSKANNNILQKWEEIKTYIIGNKEKGISGAYFLNYEQMKLFTDMLPFLKGAIKQGFEQYDQQKTRIDALGTVGIMHLENTDGVPIKIESEETQS